jgi:hypothetical protein
LTFWGCTRDTELEKECKISKYMGMLRLEDAKERAVGITLC